MTSTETSNKKSEAYTFSLNVAYSWFCSIFASVRYFHYLSLCVSLLITLYDSFISFVLALSSHILLLGCVGSLNQDH